MPGDEKGPSLPHSLRTVQDDIERAGPAISASYSIIGAIILLGGCGYGFDRWRGTAPWGLFSGLMLGLVVGFYQLAMLVWRRK